MYLLTFCGLYELRYIVAVELDHLQLKGVRDFYNDMVGGMDKYDVSKTDCKLCMLMVHKNQDALYA
jgi:hypothetical protein